ncbi:MAG: hypothetical protein NT080_08430 [Spirochaetes bacterium]|nr:hypothetical protein [Spirochaetota bacterium]
MTARDSASWDAILERSLAAEGLDTPGFLGRESLQAALTPVKPADARPGSGQGSGRLECAAIERAYAVSAARGAVVVALPYDTTDPEPLPAGAARIAWFARFDHYGELVARIGRAAAPLRAAGAFRRPDIRCLSNSRIDEKRLAVAAGLGFIGRHSLLMTEAFGCSCVLGFALLPFDPLDATGRPRPVILPGAGEPGGRCGSCHACVGACPTQAIGADGGIDTERCIQAWTARPGPLPDIVAANWGNRLYGCDACIAACPYGHIGRALEPVRGSAGAFVDASSFADASEDEVRSRFRGTALGMHWIEPAALRRNALLALRAQQWTQRG